MNRIANIVKTAVTIALGTLVLAGGALAVDGFSAGLGCSANCITSALVTPTASSATVTVKTSVPASITATVSEQSTQLGLASTAPAPKHQLLPGFATTRVIAFPGLQPDTTYRISVSARDQQGRTLTRVGTFKTRKVQVAVEVPNLPLASGAGCSVKCIQKALIAKHATQVGRVDFEIATAVPARLSLKVYLRNAQNQIVFQRLLGTSPGFKTWKPVVDGLQAGTTYRVRLSATDAKGNEHIVAGQFKTANATATVTFHKHDIIADGEVGRGEIRFDYFAGGTSVQGRGYAKLSSGDTVAAYASGTSRPTVTIVTSVDGLATLDIHAFGDECDSLWMKNCPIEVVSNGPTEADVRFDLRQLYSEGALPDAYGTGLPAGHDAYVVWETSSGDMRFRTYVTIDVQVAS